MRHCEVSAFISTNFSQKILCSKYVILVQEVGVPDASLLASAIMNSICHSKFSNVIMTSTCILCIVYLQIYLLVENGPFEEIFLDSNKIRSFSP